MQTIEAATMKDEVGERIVAAGLEHNTFLLDLNRSLSTPRDWPLPAPWYLPSRLFRFPIEVSDFSGEPRRLGMRHPRLQDHPFVRHVAEVLQIEVPVGGAPNSHGYSTCSVARWWHAVDLMTKAHWRDLLATRQFTTDEDIARAAAFALSCNTITVSIARSVMRELQKPAPADAIALLCKLDRPSKLTSEGGSVCWPVNRGSVNASEQAWALIFGIEAGWLAHDRSGHINWTQLGRERYAAGPGTVFVETSSGQGAFAF